MYNTTIQKDPALTHLLLCDHAQVHSDTQLPTNTVVLLPVRFTVHGSTYRPSISANVPPTANTWQTRASPTKSLLEKTSQFLAVAVSKLKCGRHLRRSCDPSLWSSAHAQYDNMADIKEPRPNLSPCEYKALKECLERNQGKKEKCEREWQEFQNACSNNRR